LLKLKNQLKNNMCGINISLKNPKAVISMNRKTSHRGLYSTEGEYNGIGLGHNRLPIQGLDHTFDCPFSINENLYLFNGEIFNYKEINPEAKSDVQVLDRDPIEFDGDFAIVKIRGNAIEIITDQYGKRQLYYRIENGEIIRISSEIKALISKDDKIDELYLQTVARFGYYFGGKRTICRNIKRFLPGTRYLIDVKSRQIVLKEKIKWKKYNGFKLKNLIEKSIRNRLTSDVPISLLYSGGLDSSIVLYHLREMRINLKIFISQNEDDMEYAVKYANELGVNLTQVPVEKSKDSHLLTESIADLGSVDLNYGLFKAVKDNGYKVVMTGDGADEIFSGYKRNQEMDYQKNDIFNELMYYHLPRLDRSAMAHTVEYRSPYTADYVIDYGLKTKYEERINKKCLRDEYRGLIPDYILNRPKVPLRLKDIKENKEEKRLELVKKWSDKLFEELKYL